MPALIECHRIAFQSLCRRRGVDCDSALDCVVAKDGDIWTVDVSHAAYPRKRAGLGDAVASGLAAVGITPQLVERVTGRKGCGCKQRQRLLNEVGYAVQKSVKEFFVGS